MWHRNVLTENSVYLRGYGAVAFLIGLIVSIVALYFLRYRNGRKLPPGPVGLPIFGYYLFLGKDPMKKLNEVAKKYGNVFGLYLGPQYIVILNDFLAMKEALSQSTALHRPPSLFAEVPYNFGVVGANGPAWVQTRRLFAKTMKDIGLNKIGWEDLIQESAQNLVRRIAEEGEKPVEVRGFFVQSFVNNVVALILGERLHLGHPSVKLMSEAVDAIIEYTPTLGMANFSPILSKLLQMLGVEKKSLLSKQVGEFAKFMSDTVDERIQNPVSGTKDSFIDRFYEEIQKHEKDNAKSYITEESLKGNVITMLTGGGETTRTTIIWTLMAMADHPDIQHKVHEELDAVIGKEGSIRWKDHFKVPYTYATLLESMRWATIVPFGTMRMASEDMLVQGYYIPKGTFITFNNWSIHNDPNYWKNPEQFIPERFLHEDGRVKTSSESFNPFSYGRRNCPGKLMAEMAALQYLVVIMKNFKVVPKDGKRVQYDTILGLTYQAANVELRFIPR